MGAELLDGLAVTFKLVLKFKLEKLIPKVPDVTEAGCVVLL